MKADFPAVARPWQWGGSRDGLGMADPSLSRGQLCHTKGDGCVSAEMCGQPQPPRAGIRPRVQREVGTHGGSRGCWGKKRKGGGKLAGSCPSPSPEAAPCLLLAVRDAHPACLGCPALQRSPGSFQGWERKQFEYIGRTWASLGGGRPWQCCVRGSQGGTASPGCPFTVQGAGGRQSQCGEARGTCLKIHSPNLTFPCSKAKTSSRSRGWNHQRDQRAALGQKQQPQRKKTAEGFEAPGWH